MAAEPLVSVLTPVYNGAPYLKECIESVLAQDYGNWEYVVLNNASTDDTLAIASEYGRRDTRIRVHSNETLVDIITNHNRAFRLASAEAAYCKVVSADDWIFPHCLTEMVRVAEAHPSVGIVGSYQMSGGGPDRTAWRVRWDQVAYPAHIVPGREICRSQLLGEPYVFGTPTSLLYRADLVRSEESFFPNVTPEADTSACYKQLQKSDFGFVHQILSYERDGHVRATTRSKGYNAYLPSQLSDLMEFGPSFLTSDELATQIDRQLWKYYDFLAASFLERRGPEFWTFHRERMRRFGHPLSKRRVARAVLARTVRAARSVDRTLRGKVDL